MKSRYIVAVCLALGAYVTWSQAESRTPESRTLRIGFGLVRGTAPDMGLEALIRVMESEPLIGFTNDGRPEPRVADRWTVSDDRLTLTLHVRDGVQFQDGHLLTAEQVRRMLIAQLPRLMGPSFADVSTIAAPAPATVVITLKRPSALLLDSVAIDIYDPEHGGTSAYRRSGPLELAAHDGYWGGRPEIDQIVFKVYQSVRAAWADMLRGGVDMLYDVDAAAADSLAESNTIASFHFQRRYANELQLNTQHPKLRDPEVRRRLNAAIDRETLVANVFGGHGRPEESPLWPAHWTAAHDLARVTFQPRPLEQPLALTCILIDDVFDKLALEVQRQLAAIGVTLTFEVLPLDEFRTRWMAGDFELALLDLVRGPSVQRLIDFWRTGGPANYAHYSNPAADTAIEAIRESADDASYRRGVMALVRALVSDPPSIFLSWSESVRAVNTRFMVHQEPGRDVINTIRQWHLAPTPPPSFTH